MTFCILLTFWILVCFRGNYWVFEFFEKVILNTFSILTIFCYLIFSFKASLNDFLIYFKFLFLGVSGVIFWVFVIFKIWFLIFFYCKSSLISDFSSFEVSIHEFLIYWKISFGVFLGVFAVNIEFLNFLKMTFLIFFHSNYSLFLWIFHL